MSVGRPPGRVAGDWLVLTMIYASPREAELPGFDRWYWDLLALLPKAKHALVIAGAYDSDGTIRELLEEAKRRGIAVTLHFLEGGAFRRAFEQTFPKLATVVEDLDSFAESKGLPLDGPDDLTLDF